MMAYYLQTDDGTRYSIDIATRLDFNFANAIIVYESIGEDGGYSLNNGRLNSTLNINVSIKADSIDDAYSIIAQLKNIRAPVIVGGRSSLGRIFGKFLISGFPGTIDEGSELIKITIGLVEYRQANVKTTLLNAVYEDDPIIDFLKRLNYTSQ